MSDLIVKRRRWRRRAGALSAAESYTMSEVRGSGLEYQAVTAQERPRGATRWPRGATLRPRSGVVPEAKGGSRKEQPHAQG